MLFALLDIRVFSLFVFWILETKNFVVECLLYWIQAKVKLVFSQKYGSYFFATFPNSTLPDSTLTVSVIPESIFPYSTLPNSTSPDSNMPD